MKNILKISKILIIFLAGLIIGLMFHRGISRYIHFSDHEIKDSRFPSNDSRQLIADTIKNSWSASLANLQRTGEWKLSDFEQLEFTLPHQSGFGSLPKKEVFNRSSPFNFQILSPSFLDDVSGKNNTVPIFNLRRRISPNATIIDTLYMIIPDTSCSMATQNTFEVLESHHQIIGANFFIGESDEPSCFLEENRREKFVYRAFPIITRYRGPTDNGWISEQQWKSQHRTEYLRE